MTNIYETFESKKISDFENLKNIMYNKKNLQKIYRENFFFKNINPNDFLFDKALSESISKIKELSLKLAWYYNKDKLKMEDNVIYFSFWYNIFRNWLKQNSTNFFPLLTELVMNLFKLFKVENKKEKDCIKYIKDSLKDYFNIGENNEIKVNSIKLIKTNMLFQKEEKSINQKNIDKIVNEEDEYEQNINEKNILSESNDNINTNNLNFLNL